MGRVGPLGVGDLLAGGQERTASPFGSLVLRVCPREPQPETPGPVPLGGTATLRDTACSWGRGSGGGRPTWRLSVCSSVSVSGSPAGEGGVPWRWALGLCFPREPGDSASVSRSARCRRRRAQTRASSAAGDTSFRRGTCAPWTDGVSPGAPCQRFGGGGRARGPPSGRWFCGARLRVSSGLGRVCLANSGCVSRCECCGPSAGTCGTSRGRRVPCVLFFYLPRSALLS